MFSRKLVNRLNLPHRHILVCEDVLRNQAAVAQHFAQLFEHEGNVEVSYAAGGAAAAAIIANLPIHLIFLDHDMPDGDGPELLKWMHTINKKIPVITFSGIPYNNEHLAHLGAEYMFTKQEVIDGKADNVIWQILEQSVVAALSGFPTPVTVPYRGLKPVGEHPPAIRGSVTNRQCEVEYNFMPIKITRVEAIDVRFPTSREHIGSDAMNPDPDYSAAYCILRTDQPEFAGHGLTFTIGRGNELCVAAIRGLAHLVEGRTLESFTENMGAFWRHIVGDSQLRWVGPEKGVIHLATAAVVNAVWDLWAKSKGKPVWKLLADMTPEEIVRCIDFRYIADALSPGDALEILRRQEPGRAARESEMREKGYPAYTTSAGWIGFSDAQLMDLCREAIAQGWSHFKIKVGADIDDDIRRSSIIREEIGPDRRLMMDANQRWDVGEAIANMQRLARFNPWWIEEPTSPDDVLGHAAIRRGIHPIKIATGEHCQNRVIFKQLMQAEAIDFCQIDSCRLGGINEILSVLLMAAKFGVPVCPHAGGVGLCEYVQHLSIFDYICVSGSLEGRLIEYVDHLHEHFLDPVRMRNAHYMPPARTGYSIEMRPESLATYQFPNGPVWR